MQSLTCRRVNQAVIFWHIVQLARFIFRFFTPNLFPDMVVWPLSKERTGAITSKGRLFVSHWLTLHVCFLGMSLYEEMVSKTFSRISMRISHCKNSNHLGIIK